MCGDATNWDENAYRESILKEREIQTLTVFRTAWAPSPNPSPDAVVVASSDGSIASYSISSCISKLVPSLPPFSLSVSKSLFVLSNSLNKYVIGFTLVVLVDLFYSFNSHWVLAMRRLNSK